MTADHDVKQANRIAAALRKVEQDIPAHVREELEPIGERLRALGGNDSRNAVETGKTLNLAASKLKAEKGFMAWCVVKRPDDSHSQIINLRKAADICEAFQFTNFANLTPSSLYLLGARGKNDSMVQRIIQRARSEKVQHKTVQQALKDGIPKPPEPDKKKEPSTKHIMTRKELEKFAEMLGEYLKAWEHYGSMIVAVKEKGLDLHASVLGMKGWMEIINVVEKLEPIDDRRSQDELRDQKLNEYLADAYRRELEAARDLLARHKRQEPYRLAMRAAKASPDKGQGFILEPKFDPYDAAEDAAGIMPAEPDA
ncbi:hypothetical protein [Mesorhizobium sp. M0037]|uniref:hypothetical protein n=1 Tax=unclassified Mesorhizobium TaxID=325217 RepID=UPI003339758E